MPSNENVINEYLLDAYQMKKQQYETLRKQFDELTERYEYTLNTYTDVCRRSDRMQKAGDRLRDLLIVGGESEAIDQAIQEWGEANV